MTSTHKIVLGVVALALIGAAGYFLTHRTYTPELRLASDSEQTAAAETLAEEQDLTLIYSEEVKTTQDNNRSWPTVNIVRKAGEAKPEILATVGKVGEYPNGFLMSKDNTSLYINLESKIQKLDLASKKLTDVVKAKKQFNSLALSSDGTKMFAWDQVYASDDQNYFLHVVNLKDMSDTIVAQGNKPTDRGFYSAQKWRADDKIVLLLGAGEAGWVGSFDLKTAKFEASTDTAYGFVSESGKVMAINSSTVGDACNELFASAPNKLNVIEPVTAKVLYKDIGQKGKIIAPIVFSEDDKQLMYTLADENKDRTNCYDPKSTYYIRDLASGKDAQVTDLIAKLSEWRALTAGLVYRYEPESSTVTIKLGDKVLFGPVDKGPQIIKVY